MKRIIYQILILTTILNLPCTSFSINNESNLLDKEVNLTNKNNPELNNNKNQECTTYILKIKFPQNIEHPPKINGCYKGYRLEFENNLCFIKQTQPSGQFIFVITPEIEPKIEGNNVKYLERHENKPCRLFYVSYNHENKEPEWLIEEELAENLPLRIPEDALILFMDPNYIKTIECSENSKKESVQIINLPEIIIKNEISQSELQIASIHSLLASLDVNAICTPLKKVSKQERTVIVSMKLLQR